VSQTNPAGLMIFWDYDTQWGGDRSRAGQGRRDWGALEFPNTDKLLEVHARYSIPACFAVVGAAALPGERPYHDPAQIRRIHEAGHEVGSHSFHHDWLPGLTPAGLRKTLKQSKDALEQCIGDRVTAFVPPYNQPFHYPGKLAFSLSERREAGPRHIGLHGVCDALAETGYEFCRVAYKPVWKHLAERLTGKQLAWPAHLERIAGVRCVQLNTPCGFDSRAQEMLDRSVREGGLTVAYGHPHSLFTGGTQDLKHLDPFLAHAAGYVREGKLAPLLPRELADTGQAVAKRVSGAARV
jgi:peptidoglycan/xylan/chitin deacetylase (PgdA/CDA1 family)